MRGIGALANVTVLTLYHHDGRADGLLSAAIRAAFAPFIAGKKAATRTAGPVEAP